MAKNKSKRAAGQQFMSPDKYLTNRARTLKIGKCYYTKSLFDAGEGHVIVSRLHTGGKISYANYLVDMLCLGVKDSFYRLRLEPDEWEETIEYLNDRIGLTECSYEDAHNIVWGAVDFAEEGGIKPHESFGLTQYMLEEDTEDIPLKDFDFGSGGQHLLIVKNQNEAKHYLPRLKAALGNDFRYMVQEKSFYNYDPAYVRAPSFGEQTEYTYEPPKEYIAKPTLHNPWLVEELSKPENAIYLPDSLTDRILALPSEDLREDLEQIILYYMGYTQDGNIPDDYETDENFNGMLATAVTLLGEVGNESSSLDVVLEVLRQSDYFFHYHFGDAARDILVPTLYKLGHNQLDKFFDFMKEAGLTVSAKYWISETISQIIWLAPERRDEVKDWFTKVIQFMTEKLPEVRYFDSDAAGLITCGAINTKITELLPYIKKMYETGCVNPSIAGTYQEVEEAFTREKRHLHDCELDIHKQFRDLKQAFGHNEKE